MSADTPHAEPGQATRTAGAAAEDPYAAEHRWILIRMLGWMLIGLWQTLSLASEFVPIDLNRQELRIAGKVLGLIGLVFVAYGFERLAELAHEHAHRRYSWVPRVRVRRWR